MRRFHVARAYAGYVGLQDRLLDYLRVHPQSPRRLLGDHEPQQKEEQRLSALSYELQQCGLWGV